jgi:hypothetical protein
MLVKDHVFASKFPLQKSVTGQMPLIPHAMQVVVAHATLSKNGIATSLSDTIITTVMNNEIENADIQYDTNPAVTAPAAMTLASLMAATATLTRATQASSKPACGTHIAGGVFQG